MLFITCWLSINIHFAMYEIFSLKSYPIFRHITEQGKILIEFINFCYQIIFWQGKEADLYLLFHLMLDIYSIRSTKNITIDI